MKVFYIRYCVVSILRSGNAFLPEIMKLMPGITVG
jgi:uracil phosphoribosyltransferase